ncbi:Restriction endonuclease fold toxin 5 [Amycolatopsis xylanica]|uniref:Restriction endonuclease fold toxin 5 n=2 Tax=Amycolatopsis xylanica TaxID=589385 RepID=A0A1H3STJ5_9PSEU|nr:Restriction endonuclease fold toxin 5 [Amycolatopsis xylanica]
MASVQAERLNAIARTPSANANEAKAKQAAATAATKKSNEIEHPAAKRSAPDQKQTANKNNDKQSQDGKKATAAREKANKAAEDAKKLSLNARVGEQKQADAVEAELDARKKEKAAGVKKPVAKDEGGKEANFQREVAAVEGRKEQEKKHAADVQDVAAARAKADHEAAEAKKPSLNGRVGERKQADAVEAELDARNKEKATGIKKPGKAENQEKAEEADFRQNLTAVAGRAEQEKRYAAAMARQSANEAAEAAQSPSLNVRVAERKGVDAEEAEAKAQEKERIRDEGKIPQAGQVEYSTDRLAGRSGGVTIGSTVDVSRWATITDTKTGEGIPVGDAGDGKLIAISDKPLSPEVARKLEDGWTVEHGKTADGRIVTIFHPKSQYQTNVEDLGKQWSEVVKDGTVQWGELGQAAAGTGAIALDTATLGGNTYGTGKQCLGGGENCGGFAWETVKGVATVVPVGRVAGAVGGTAAKVIGLAGKGESVASRLPAAAANAIGRGELPVGGIIRSAADATPAAAALATRPAVVPAAVGASARVGSGEARGAVQLLERPPAAAPVVPSNIGVPGTAVLPGPANAVPALAGRGAGATAAGRAATGGTATPAALVRPATAMPAQAAGANAAIPAALAMGGYSLLTGRPQVTTEEGPPPSGTPVNPPAGTPVPPPGGPTFPVPPIVTPPDPRAVPNPGIAPLPRPAPNPDTLPEPGPDIAPNPRPAVVPNPGPAVVPGPGPAWVPDPGLSPLDQPERPAAPEKPAEPERPGRPVLPAPPAEPLPDSGDDPVEFPGPGLFEIPDFGRAKPSSPPSGPRPVEKPEFASFPREASPPPDKAVPNARDNPGPPIDARGVPLDVGNPAGRWTVPPRRTFHNTFNEEYEQEVRNKMYAPPGQEYFVEKDGESAYFDSRYLDMRSGRTFEVLVDAKGRYSQFFDTKTGDWKPFFKKFEKKGVDAILKEARRQVRVADGRPVEWWSAQRNIAALLRHTFGMDPELRGKISVRFEPKR